MKLLLPSLIATVIVAAAPAQSPPASTAGQNVTGTVINATTGQPAAHQPIALVQLQGNMQSVASTSTDAQGRYRFSETSAGPFMVEADYENVPYFAQVTAGQSETNVEVYEATADASLLTVDAEIMVLQPDAGQLAVVNEYRVENDLKPARTLYTTSGLFRFSAPPNAQVDMVRVLGPGEMPLARQAEPAGKPGQYRVATPLRPGETKIQVSYRVPYASAKAALSESPLIKPAHFEVYVPTPMTFQGDGFAQVGTQDGYVVFGVNPSAVPATMTFNVAGTAPLPAAATQGDSAAAVTGATASSPAPSDASAPPPAPPAGQIPAPTFFEKNLWTIFALLGLGAAAGFGILLAQREPAPAGPSIPAPAISTDSEIKQLKDDLFLLEVRRHTGNLDETEYTRLRAELNARMDRLAGK